MTIRYLSLFSGIEAATVAWRPLGWVPVGFSEVAPFPCAVLAHHYPRVENFGDITKYKDWPDGAIDLVVGGSPCQSFSIAGNRGGMDDPRGGLMQDWLGVVARYRPRWAVWENVPGVLSSGGGRDFGTLLGRLANIGYGFAYRILDAQFFGVPQRRRRVFVVGYLGDWRPPAAVLFEQKSLRGHPPPHREAGDNPAASPAGCIDGRRKIRDDGLMPIVARTLTTRGQRNDYETENFVVCVKAFYATSSGQNGFGVGDIASTMKSSVSHLSVQAGQMVRRLTPRECERLQGLPDDYTKIAWRGRPAEQCPDTPRYRAIGNSMAVPVMYWIGKRIQSVNNIICR